MKILRRWSYGRLVVGRRCDQTLFRFRYLSPQLQSAEELKAKKRWYYYRTLKSTDFLENIPFLTGNKSPQLPTKLTLNRSRASFQAEWDDRRSTPVAVSTCWFKYHVRAFSEPRSGPANEYIDAWEGTWGGGGSSALVRVLITTGRYWKQELFAVLTRASLLFFFSWMSLLGENQILTD